MGWTFTAVTIAWVFFRADSIDSAFHYLLTTTHINTGGNSISAINCLQLFLWLTLTTTFEWALMRNKLNNTTPAVRMMCYVILVVVIIAFGPNESSGFIYFQF